MRWDPTFVTTRHGTKRVHLRASRTRRSRCMHTAMSRPQFTNQSTGKS